MNSTLWHSAFLYKTNPEIREKLDYYEFFRIRNDIAPEIFSKDKVLLCYYSRAVSAFLAARESCIKTVLCFFYEKQILITKLVIIHIHKDRFEVRKQKIKLKLRDSHKNTIEGIIVLYWHFDIRVD